MVDINGILYAATTDFENDNQIPFPVDGSIQKVKQRRTFSYEKILNGASLRLKRYSIFGIREIEKYASEVHEKYSQKIEKPHHLF
jgi:hypothetical protein